MDMTPISFGDASRLEENPVTSGETRAHDAPLAGRWIVLHEAAGIVASLAGVPGTPAGEIAALGDRLDAAPLWRRELLRQGIEDLTAIMEPGLAALIAVYSRGADAAVPARALLQEFEAARDALVALAIPPG